LKSKEKPPVLPHKISVLSKRKKGKNRKEKNLHGNNEHCRLAPGRKGGDSMNLHNISLGDNISGEIQNQR